MIIQNTSPTNQAVQPDTRAHGAVPALPVKTAERAAATPAAQPIPRQPSVEELKSAVELINQAMQQSNRSLEFHVDTDTHQTVVRMVDTSTGELLRQFPSEATLAISRGIEQFQQGLLVTQKA